MTEVQTDDVAAQQVAREAMSDWLGVPIEECSENSRGALLIRDGIHRYLASLPPPPGTPSVVQELVEALTAIKREARKAKPNPDAIFALASDALLTRVKGGE